MQELGAHKALNKERGSGAREGPELVRRARWKGEVAGRWGWALEIFRTNQRIRPSAWMPLLLLLFALK